MVFPSTRVHLTTTIEWDSIVSFSKQPYKDSSIYPENKSYELEELLTRDSPVTTRPRTMLFTFLLSFLHVSSPVFAFNFPYESIQLRRSDIGNNSDIKFGDRTNAEQPRCKSFPGYKEWPSAERWSAFNVSLGGALLRATPPAAACYEGEFRDALKCNVVRRGQNSVLFAYVRTSNLEHIADYS
jgi:hypothetical protein